MRRVKRAKLYDRDHRLGVYEVSEDYALSHYRINEFELLIYDRKIRQYKFSEPAFGTLRAADCIGESEAYEITKKKPGITYIRNTDFKLVFKVHVI